MREISVDFPRSESRTTPHPPAASTQSEVALLAGTPSSDFSAPDATVGKVLIAAPAAPALARLKLAVPRLVKSASCSPES